MKRSLSVLSLICLAPLVVFAGETVSLFNGKTLEGWKPVIKEDAKYWSVIDGVITGGDGVQKIPHNSFLRTEKAYGDFEFRCLFRLTGDPSIPSKGFIGIQLHSGGNAKIEVSDISITEF